MRRSNFFSALLGALVVAVPFGVAAAGGSFDGKDAPSALSSSGSSGSSGSSAPAVTGKAKNLTDVSSLYQAVRNGVVYVQVTTQQSTLFGTQSGGASGSGIVLDKQGHILTNDHVVQGATTVAVRIGDGKSLIPAKVTGADPSSDLAVLKVNPSSVQGGLHPLALGSSKDVKVGQPAIAIGSPFGLQGTLTTGVVSALDRPIESPNHFTIDGAVQTDAAINPGNSGGPLLNASGQVIGINAQIATSSDSNSGVGFAIPIDTAKQVVPVLENGGTIRRPYLGVSTQDTVNGSGAQVAQVVGRGPSARALQTGDTIVQINSTKITQSADVADAISNLKPGDKVTVTVERGGGQKTVTVTLGTRPKEAS